MTSGSSTNNEFILRTSGVVGLGIPILFAVFGAGLIYIGFIEVNILGFLMGILAIAYAVWYYFSPYIKINDREFVAKFVFTKQLGTVEKTVMKRASISDISSVAIGRIRYFQEHQELLGEEIKEFIAYYLSRPIAIRRTGTTVLALPLVPIMAVRLKDGSCLTVAIKPFSKNGLRRLIKEFQKRGIKVVTDQNLGLE